ncbi:hypothetical protein, partial [Mesorhizobium sp. M7A.F.Ca.US.002.01.1.1]|uniref:hypothetical protein n=1 Tax=Mesorhizobium sp. M7A.F.Ca.US.002.01.1.1 TaxID=2496700 RepID=UPI0019D4DBC8
GATGSIEAKWVEMAASIDGPPLQTISCVFEFGGSRDSRQTKFWDVSSKFQWLGTGHISRGQRLRTILSSR